MCWSKYEQYPRAERDRTRTESEREDENELRRLEAAAAGMRAEQLFAEKARHREPVAR